jgi:hypothetical protein
MYFNNTESLEVRNQFVFHTRTFIFQKAPRHILLTEAIFQRPSITSSSATMRKTTVMCWYAQDITPFEFYAILYWWKSWEQSCNKTERSQCGTMSDTSSLNIERPLFLSKITSPEMLISPAWSFSALWLYFATESFSQLTWEKIRRKT